MTSALARAGLSVCAQSPDRYAILLKKKQKVPDFLDKIRGQLMPIDT
jgi:hypothetical protein